MPRHKQKNHPHIRYEPGSPHEGNDDRNDENDHKSEPHNNENDERSARELNISDEHIGLPIPVVTTNRAPKPNSEIPVRNVKTIKRSNKVGEALELPSVMNINPRSVYNKPEELQALITEEDIDCTFLSESWERPDLTLEQLLSELEDNYRVISNPYARTQGRTGGRPALIIKKDKYNIKDLTNTLINIPWKVEATWAALTPKNVSQGESVN